MTKCQHKDCDELAVLEVRNVYPEGSVTAELHGTTSRLECEYHGQESKMLAPYLDWERIGGTTK